eukprot:gnl/Chilomastix_cuspidata/3624.p1 GENE.gnl/Chilomastix_cuspidata/3624~~gnl/Chilomastix_cuspidata/3624.p1  ORF type:complete len:841 (-),score=330.15 gnl/Chilomastix_cuspidata/3624:23-2545(-)
MESTHSPCCTDTNWKELATYGNWTSQWLQKFFTRALNGDETKASKYLAPKHRVYNHRRAAYQNDARCFFQTLRALRTAFSNLHQDKTWSIHGTETQAQLWCTLRGSFDAPLQLNSDECIPPSRTEFSFSIVICAHFEEARRGAEQNITELWYLPDYVGLCQHAERNMEQYLIPGLLADSYHTQRHLRSALVRPRYSVFQARDNLYAPAIPQDGPTHASALRSSAENSCDCAQIACEMLREAQNQSLQNVRSYFAAHTVFQSPYKSKPITRCHGNQLLMNIKNTFLNGHDVYYDVLFMMHGLIGPDHSFAQVTESPQDLCFVTMAVDRRSVKLRDVAVSLEPPLRSESDEYQKPGELSSPVPRGTVVAPNYRHTRVLHNYYFLFNQQTKKIIAFWSVDDYGSYFAQLQVTPPISTEESIYGAGPAASRAALRLIASAWKGEVDKATLSRFLSRSVTNHTVWPFLRGRMGVEQAKSANGLRAYKVVIDYMHRFLSAVDMRLKRLIVSDDSFAASLIITGNAVEHEFKPCQFDACVYGCVPADKGVITELWYYADLPSANYQAGAAPRDAGALYQEPVQRVRAPAVPGGDTLLTDRNISAIHRMFAEYSGMPANKESAVFMYRGRPTLATSSVAGHLQSDSEERLRNIWSYFSPALMYSKVPYPGESHTIYRGRDSALGSLIESRDPYVSIKLEPAIYISQGPFAACWMRLKGWTVPDSDTQETKILSNLSEDECEEYQKRFRTWRGRRLRPNRPIDSNYPMFFALDVNSRIADMYAYPDRVTQACQLGVEFPKLAKEGSATRVFETIGDHLRQANRRSIGYTAAKVRSAAPAHEAAKAGGIK